ncbi:MAG TPA: EI24 domain-containing protein [Saprospiraceae bacterium]|nr:EI24 domain-containing protein [Saprospiraceae bacterium]
MINFSRGFFDYVAAIGKIGTYKLWGYVIITTLASIILGLMLFGSIYSFGDDFGAFLIGLYPFEWGSAILAKVIDWISRLVLWTVAFFLFKYAIIIILSPVMSLISAKIEKVYTGQAAARFTLIRELIRGLQFNIRNLFKELVFIILFFLLSFVPVIGFIAPFLLFFTQAYFAGLGVMDYFMERHYTINESLAVGRKNKFYLTGIGSGFMLTILIPVLGIMFAPILGTIAATEFGCKDKVGLV